MDEERVLERRPVFTARQWDGSEGVLDWLRPGLDQGLMAYNPRDEVLSQWGQTVEQGAWIVDRGGWYDVQPDNAAYQKKYETAPDNSEPQ